MEQNSFSGQIEFKNVNFSYIKNQKVLDNISFKINPSETFAIVGPTGSGKTTISNLITKFYELDSGNILLDGNDIDSYNLENIRNKVGIILQDVFLFADTIFNNITLHNKSISIDEVIVAAKQIGIHEFIMTLPNNYYYNVKERGAMLSSGQRQLIAFLRAYVSKPSILILDEATSSVDPASEKLIQFATEQITKNRTSIIIAHRLTTVKKADNIIVMDKGEIVGIGKHNSLIKNNKFYLKIYKKGFE